MRSFILFAQLCVLVLLTPSAVAAPADPDAALKDVVAQLNNLDKWITDAEKKRVTWLKEVRSQDQQVATISAQAHKLEQAYQRSKSDLTNLHKKRTVLRIEQADQADLIAKHVTATYRLSGQDFVKQLLNQEAPETITRMSRYHRYFTDARMQTLENYRQTMAALATTEIEIGEEADRQKRKQAELKGKSSELVAQRDARKQHLAQLSEEVESKTSERKRLQADQQRLQKLIAELRQRATTLDGGKFSALQGSLPWPATGKVRRGFGQSRADGRLKWHGMVIDIAQGTPVKAVHRGRVVFSDWLRGYGLLTIVDHGDGFMTLYGQVESLLKTVDDIVESGETIARAGNSGGQASGGLYFEVRHKGEVKDPAGWLKARS